MATMELGDYSLPTPTATCFSSLSLGPPSPVEKDKNARLPSATAAAAAAEAAAAAAAAAAAVADGMVVADEALAIEDMDEEQIGDLPHDRFTKLVQNLPADLEAHYRQIRKRVKNRRCVAKSSSKRKSRVDSLQKDHEAALEELERLRANNSALISRNATLSLQNTQLLQENSALRRHLSQLAPTDLSALLAGLPAVEQPFSLQKVKSLEKEGRQPLAFSPSGSPSALAATALPLPSPQSFDWIADLDLTSLPDPVGSPLHKRSRLLPGDFPQ